MEAGLYRQPHLYTLPNIRHQNNLQKPGKPSPDCPPLGSLQNLAICGNPHQRQNIPISIHGMDLERSSIESRSIARCETLSSLQDTEAQADDLPPPYSSDPKLQKSLPPAHSLDSGIRTVTEDGSSALATGNAAERTLIAIPATSKKLGSPFLRAYPPALQAHGISRESFIQFIDRLNRAAVANPPIQVLGLAGNVVGMVPLHQAQIVGGVVNFAATVATAAVSKGRTEILLKEADSTMFAPAGLKVQIAKLDVVAKLAKIPILDAEGKVDKRSSILSPLDESQGASTLSVQERRVQALSEWLSPLEVESLPQLDESDNMLGKAHAWASERQRQKEEKKMVRSRHKTHQDLAKRDSKEGHKQEKYEEKMSEYDAKERKIQEKGGRRMEHELRDLGKKREKQTHEFEKEIGKGEKSRRKGDKEEESMRKILFLIVQKI